jgi:cell division FtsZ-interacting protein ZapD
MNENCRLLLDTICQIFLDGLEADEGLVNYIDATYSYPSISDLMCIIEGDDSDRDGLLELIFFPGEKIQQKVQKAIGNVTFSCEDIETVADELARHHLKTTLYFTDGRGALPIDVPRNMSSIFFQRLNLTQPIDGKLLDAIVSSISPPDQSAVIVKLRNHRKKLDRSKIYFLTDFIEKMGQDQQFLEYLDFLLEVLEEIDENANIYGELANRRQICQRQLHEAERFEEKLSRENIEILIMRGERVTHMSKEGLLKKLTFIDMISLSVFGKLAITP